MEPARTYRGAAFGFNADVVRLGPVFTPADSLQVLQPKTALTLSAITEPQHTEPIEKTVAADRCWRMSAPDCNRLASCNVCRPWGEMVARSEAVMPSTVIRSFQYDEASRTLLIIFQSGRRYRYLDVPAATVRDLRAAFSKGKFFNSRIRGSFAYTEEPFELASSKTRDRRRTPGNA
jgi:hypothetical protein